ACRWWSAGRAVSIRPIGRTNSSPASSWTSASPSWTSWTAGWSTDWTGALRRGLHDDPDGRVYATGKDHGGRRPMTDITDRPAQAGEDRGWIFHFAEAARWAAATPGAYRGGRLCETDGFIHCSTADQLAETARLHLKGRDDLMLVTI